MGKRAEQAKKRKRNNDGNKSCAVATHSAPGHPANPASKANSLPSPPMTEELGTMVDPADLMVTVDTIQYLCENPDELVGKEMKELKRGVHELYRVMVDGAGLGTSLTSKISSALQDYRFTDALVYLFEMYTRAIPPKLGALQRWVRECDATDQQGGGGRDKGAMKCLDMILRIAGMEGETSVEKRQQQRENEDEALAAGASWTRATVAEDEDGLIRRKGVFRARGPVDTEIKVWELVQQGKVFDTPPPNPYPSFKAVHHLPGHMRKPPNLYSSTVYASEPGAIVLHPAPRPSAPRRVDVPGVPGAFVVLDVFTPEECLQIVKAAEGVGFEKDEAAGGSAINKQSILAKNFVWLADKPFLEHFYSQILPFVPPSAPVSVDGNGGGHVRGINARFRVYQYTENQVYRAHIDGAWPAAGLDKVTGEYLHDSSPPDDPLWSRYTLLVYLNSDIPDDSGCTTFFMPSDTMGVMEATSVKPIQGAVLCFPHGDTQGSLLHEGSGVTAGGGKFVIRTDLLYEAKGFGQYKPPASVGVKQGGKGEEGIGG